MFQIDLELEHISNKLFVNYIFRSQPTIRSTIITIDSFSIYIILFIIIEKFLKYMPILIRYLLFDFSPLKFKRIIVGRFILLNALISKLEQFKKQSCD